MNYFNPCPLPADEAVVSAWDSQLRRIQAPWVEQFLAEHGHELFQRFASCYAELTALPRSARRALQRRLASSDNLLVSSEWRRKLACSVAGAALLMALGQTAADAATKTPTIKLSSKCTLYNAINAAYYATNVIQQPFNKKTAYYFGLPYYGCKAAPGVNTIVLPKTATTLQKAARIMSPIIIQGAKAKKPKKGQNFVPGIGGTIHGPAGYTAFNVYSGASLKLYNVTVTGGGSPYAYGGVIYNGYGASVSLTISAISGASAIRGGGIYNRGNLTITGSTISGNTANYGGGIFNAGNLTIGNATVLSTLVVSSTISGNTANFSGGGIYNNNTGSATITSSTISGNTATTYSGGGIYNTGSATITGNTISGNTASQHGGGVWNGIGGTFALTSSTITGNNSYSGGGIYNAYSLAVSNSSTISNNTAYFGGGLLNAVGGNAYFTASTVSGNHATVFKGALTYDGGIGGGIDNLGGLSINSSMITGNVAEGKAVPVPYNPPTIYGGKGGGIFNASDVNFYTGSSVTSNTAAYYGGGLYNYVTATPPYVPTGTITANTAPTGADIFP